MRIVFKRILTQLLVLCLVLPGLPVRAEEEPAEQPTIYPMKVVRTPANLEAAGALEPYADCGWVSAYPELMNADLSHAPGLAYSLSFADDTILPSADRLPAGFDPQALLEWGKYPGLNVDVLHEHGFTGKGAVIAYVDGSIEDHEQYAGENVHYLNKYNDPPDVHGTTVLSLLAGKDIGTAPEAEVYYFAQKFDWDADQKCLADCLYHLLEVNRGLPEDKRITMVGFSNNIDDACPNADALRTAVKACEDAGIMVWFCGEYSTCAFVPGSDKNDYRNVTAQTMYYSPTGLHVPASGRTSAKSGGQHYIYWQDGGLSWTMPYMLGLYAIVIEIDPTLTQDELRKLALDTAYVNDDDMQIVDPVAFVSAALRRVGREAEAQAMEDEVKARTRYLYAVMNTATMSEEDLKAAGSYLAAVTDATVLVADAGRFAGVKELYTALRDDARERGGTVAGVQIFGTADMVPSFEIKYLVQMVDGVDDAGTLLTDLFFGNFENDPAALTSGYSVMDHFAQGWDVDLCPQWPVARLPLTKDQFAPFFKKYRAFALDTGLARLSLVNFSNPIFATSDPGDDMGRFLLRADREFGFLDAPYRLYGNLRGDYPVTYPVLGGFETENLAAENQKGPVEFLINTHGQRDNIDKAFFIDGEEQRQSLVNSGNIDQVLGENPYYMDLWTCHNGDEMKDNLTTAALQGQCVGMFSPTHILSGNGERWDASLANMANSNPFYFFYHYFKAIHQGSTRSRAFFEAQRAYCLALLEDSALPIRNEGNYQFNLYNLLAYHNFGVLEPNAACLALYDLSGGIYRVSGGVTSFVNGFVSSLVTEGTPQGEEKELTRYNGNYAPLQISRFTAQPLDNGYIRFTLSYAPAGPMRIEIWDTPDMARIHCQTKTTAPNGPQELVFDLKKEDLQAVHAVIIRFVDNSDGFIFVEIHPSEHLGIEYVGDAAMDEPPETQDAPPSTGAAAPEAGNITGYNGNFGALNIQRFNAEALDNGYIRFTLTFTPPQRMDIEIKDWPDGDLFRFRTQSADTAEPQDLVFDLKAEDLKAAASVILYFNGSDGAFLFLEFSAENVSFLNFP